MTKKIFNLFFLVAIFLLSAHDAWALKSLHISFNPGALFGGDAMSQLVENITNMAESISEASAQMMKIADMLICNSLHGHAADVKIEICAFFICASFNLFKAIALDIFLSGLVLYIIGFFITLVTSFYMLDIAFNLSISILLLPLALALWPFGWTRDKLGIVIKSILYYTGLFIFLPLGILIAKELVVTVIEESFPPDSGGIIEVFKEDKTDIIRDTFGLFTLSFLKILVAYIVALKIIPLMANDFCQHFFGSALLPDAIHQRMTQLGDTLKKKTIGKAGKFMKDVAKHQTGKAIEKMGDPNGGFLDRTIARFGKNVGKTKKD